MVNGQRLRRRALWLAVPWSAVAVAAGLLWALGRAGPALAFDWVVGVGCGPTIQACINDPDVMASDTIYIPPGTYFESVILSKSVSLRGLPGGAAGTIIQAVGGQRVLIVTSAVSQAITLSDLTFQGGSGAGAGGGIVATAPVPYTFQSLVISNNVASGTGAGLWVSGTAVISNVSFISNTSVGNGGGAWVYNATVTGSRFERNRCTGFCSGAGMLAQGALTFTDNEVLSNTSAYNGGGVGVVGNATVRDSLFQNNTSNHDGYGGGGLVAFSTAEISGTQFISNSAFSYGGGLFAWLTTTLTNTVFLNNSAVLTNARGGGAYVDLGLATITGGEFGGNTSGYRGGGLYARSNASLSSVNIHDNTAVSHGGGAWTGAAVVGGGQFTDNDCTASCLGGGLYANVLLTVTGAEFEGNQSVSNGGGAWANAAAVTGSQFTGNACTGFCSGGGLWSQSVLTLTDTIMAANNSANHGGGAAALTHAEVRGGVFENNASHTTGYGGGGLIAFGTATLSGTQFIGNSADYYGGGLYAWYTATLTNTTFMSNTALLTNSVGGAATLLRAARISGGQFSGNQSRHVGGVYLGGNGDVENTQFNGNIATHLSAGGMRADSNLTLTNVSFVGNQSVFCGGGLLTFSYTTHLRVQGGAFVDNQASNAGGGGLCNNSEATLTDTVMTGNAGTLGGGILGIGLLEVRGGLFQDNVAQEDGGAIYALFGATTISGAEISANHAGRGGGIYATADELHVLNTLLAGNTASSGQGHGLFADDPNHVTIVHTTIATPSVTAGSAIYLSATVEAGITNTLIANFGTGIEALTGTVTQDYNLFSGATAPAIGATGGAHSLTGDPDFLNPAGGDYHLGPASRALDRGTAGTGVGVDFDGEARPFGPLPDIGYDERTAGYKLYLPAVRRD